MAFETALNGAWEGENRPRREGRFSVVQRDALLVRVEAALAQTKTVFVVASPGFGKSVFLGQLAERLDRENTQNVIALSLSLDRNMATHDFVTRLRQAGRSHGHGQPGRPASLMAEAIAAVEHLASQFASTTILVDEFHRATSEMEDLVAAVIEHANDQVRFVLANRRRSTALQTKLMMAGKAAKFSENDLALSHPEVDRLLSDKLSSLEINRLLRRTSGWPAAIGLLTAQAEDTNGEWSTAANGLSGDNDALVAYFAREAYSDLPAQSRSFLERAAVLKEVRKDELPLVTEGADDEITAEESLAELPFVNFYDAGRTRIGIMPLYAEFLQKKLKGSLTPDGYKNYQRRLSEWFLRRDDIHKALLHAFESKDDRQVSHILEQKGGSSVIWMTSDFHGFGVICDHAMRTDYEGHVRLAPGLAIRRLRSGDIEGAVSVLDRAQRSLADYYDDADGIVLRTDCAMATALLSLYQYNDDIEHHIEQLEYYKTVGISARTIYDGVLEHILGMLYYRKGDLDLAARAFQQAITHHRQTETHWGFVHASVYAAHVAIERQRSDQAKQFVEGALAIWTRHLRNNTDLGRTIDAARARILYLAAHSEHDLGQAFTLLANAAPALGARRQYCPDLLFDVFRPLANLEVARFGLVTALGRAGKGVALARERGISPLVNAMRGQQIRMSLAVKSPERAEKLVSEISETGRFVEGLSRSAWRTQAEHAFGLIRYFIERGDLGKAERQLAAIENDSRRRGLTLVHLKCRIYRCFLLVVEGKDGEAVQLFRRFLPDLKSGFAGLILEEGHKATELLQKAYERLRRTKDAEVFLPYLHDLRSIAPSFEPSRSTKERLPKASTKRDVLRLVCLGDRNAAIGNKLDISLDTVKYHVKSLCKSFNVRTKAELVAAVNDLGLLTELLKDQPERATV